MGALSDESVEHHRHAIADEPIERMDPQAHPSIRNAGVHDIEAVRYSGGTWLLTCVPWYRWSWVSQEAGKLNWTLSLRTPL